MEELRKALEDVLAAQPIRMAFSLPRAGRAVRAVATRLPQGWQIERFTGTQAFHQNVDEAALPETMEKMLLEEFSQLTAFSAGWQHQVRLSKKGKVLARRQKDDVALRPPRCGHDRERQLLLEGGANIPALRDAGIFTAEGKLAAGMRDKFRQINRFVELVDDVLREKPLQTLRVVDFGCGKSYLTFLLYHYLTVMRGIGVEMTGLDLKEDVVAACNRSAKAYGYDGLHFLVGDIARHESAAPVDMVVSLHACDTATDHALAKAVAWGAPYIFSVPCCQHEANAQMHTEEYAILTRYGLVQERVASLFTDAVRANLLTACGYKTQLVEFVDFEHTPKNILIRAERKDLPKKAKTQALDEVRRLCRTFELKPCLLQLLQAQGHLPAQ